YGLPVTAIKSYAFKNCSTIIEVVIPESVTYISDYAFYGLSNLTEIVIPESVTEIGYGAFLYCSILTEIFCEAASEPSGWSSSWKSGCDATVYWGGQWEYVDGVPTPIA
ncbi:MAG: leucine-rich repeat domain-containing protein, partial [Clostridia bacterium]|nr:leucine-rich repeat domain-containing protein [Clostridia bacterium]